MNTESYIIAICIGIVSILIVSVEGQYPRLCTTDEALKNRECCPGFSAGGRTTKCGELQRRGSCVSISTLPLPANENVIFNLLLDERKEWPKVFYDRACICHGNFDGINCGKCKPGYQGITCQEKKPILTRKNIKNMERKELENFVKYVDESKRTVSQEYVILTTSYDRIVTGDKPQFSNISVYDLFVWMHYYVARNNLVLPNRRLQRLDMSDILQFSSGDNNLLRRIGNIIRLNPNMLTLNDVQDYAHEGPAFLPWHRYFLLKWEEDIRVLIAKDEKFTIPYWDWRDSDSCDVCTNLMLGARSQTNPALISRDSPVSRWEVICTKEDEYILNGRQCDGTTEGPLLRNYGAHDPSLISGIPTRADVENSLQFSSYETFPYDIQSNSSFRNILEGFADPANGTSHAGFSSMHNAVHLYMNGTMSNVGSSANDPIFVLHHAFIDSIYEVWLQDQRKLDVFSILNEDSDQANVKVGHRLRDYMVPFFPLVRNIEGFQTTEELGFKYDYLNDDERSGEFEMSGTDKITEDLDDMLNDMLENDIVLGEGNFGALGGEGFSSSVRIRAKQNRRISNKNRSRRQTQQSQNVAGDLPSQILQPGFERQVDIGREILTPWDRLVSYFQDLKRSAARVSQRDVIIYLVLPALCLASIIIAVALYCVCCSNKLKKETKPKKGCGSCCNSMICCSSSNQYDEDEGQALLYSYSKKTAGKL